MNKTELVAKIAEVAGLSKADAKKALDATVEAVKEALVAGDNVRSRRCQPQNRREAPYCCQEGSKIQGWRRAC